MSEEKLRLPDFLLADLYKSSIVEIGSPVAVEQVDQKITVKPVEVFADNKIEFLGENAKKVAIVVNQKGKAFLSDDNLAFLTNILKACQLNLADIAIINLANVAVTYQQMKTQLASKYVLLFDVEPSSIKLPFVVPAFQVQKFDDCSILVAPPLSILDQPTADGKLLKTKLWVSLKQVFGI